MKKDAKNKSATPSIIIVGSIITSIVTVNPVPFIVGISSVWLFGDKFGQRYDKKTGRRVK